MKWMMMMMAEKKKMKNANFNFTFFVIEMVTGWRLVEVSEWPSSSLLPDGQRRRYFDLNGCGRV